MNKFGNIIKINSNLKTSVVITKKSLEFIKLHSTGSTILEIGCGSGIYAKLLREEGVKVIATDVCKTNAGASMTEFTNVTAINNIIPKNAVKAVKNHGQNKSLSLFLSFPLPNNENKDRKLKRYDETALREFLGNKFFLIAMYTAPLSEKISYNPLIADGVTGSLGFHDYLAEAWDVKNKLKLYELAGSYVYLIYFERKTANKSNNDNNGNHGNNNRNGSNRLCPAGKATNWSVGNLTVGLDGTMWIVNKRTNGVKYWRRYNTNANKETHFVEYDNWSFPARPKKELPPP